jgi:hypothetical protein
MEFHGYCKVVAGTLKSRIIPSGGLSIGINFIIQQSIKSVTEHFGIYFPKAKPYSVRTDKSFGNFSYSSCPTLSASPRNHPQTAAHPRRSEAPV